MNIVILGLSITSSWGNGHATTYRSLIRGLYRRGHHVTFFERNVPWYEKHRDFTVTDYCTISLYSSLDDLINRFENEVKHADLVIVGSYVPEGVAVGEWVLRTGNGVRAFYDIDSPVTLAKLQNKTCEYLHPELIPVYDLYLSFSGGRVLEILSSKYGSPYAKPLYCSVDPDLYYPETQVPVWDLGYLGTYSDDRQPPLKELMIDASCKWDKGKFIVAGPNYPDSVEWPANIDRIDHLPPSAHRKFYNEQRFTLNITRTDMVRLGHSPSVRLFEAAACGVPVISDYWEGLEDFFRPGHEILISRSSFETIGYLRSMPETERKMIGKKARKRVLASHTGETRAVELELHTMGVRSKFINKMV
jgi:spore maturation protein CgeB